MSAYSMVVAFWRDVKSVVDHMLQLYALVKKYISDAVSGAMSPTQCSLVGFFDDYLHGVLKHRPCRMGLARLQQPPQNPWRLSSPPSSGL